jgi:cytochrome c-type protein NapC
VQTTPAREMLPVQLIVALVAGIAIVALLLAGARSLGSHTSGRVVLLVGVVALPLLLTAGNISYGLRESSTTRFCLSCHEMQRHGKSMFVDNRQALAAVHYQNRLVDRGSACYSCHKDYAMFGDVTAKLNGLRHVYAHYVAGVPQKLALYKPYPNSNCLHCHDDARRFGENPVHRPVMSALYAGTTSCLSCHRIAHDMEKVDAGQFWQAQ